MKKFISLVLATAMILSMTFVMAGCGDSKDEGSEGKDLKVVGVVSTALGDKSFNDSAKEGLDTLKKQGFDTSLVECDGDSSKWEQSLRSAADTADMVIAVGAEFTMIEKVCKDYPDVKFVWVDMVADHLSDYDNLTCIQYKQNEGSYLVGYIAGSMTKSNVVGFIGGMDIDVINDFYVGYAQGAKDANKDIKVVKRYAGSWSDPDKGAQCAQDLKAQGADIIFAAAGASGNGAILKAKDLGIKVIGVDQDQRLTMSDYADDILCSMLKNVGNSVIDMVNNYYEDNDSWTGGEVFHAGMDGDYIKVSYGGDDQEVIVPEDVRKAVDEKAEEIKSGKIVVDTVFK